LEGGEEGGVRRWGDFLFFLCSHEIPKKISRCSPYYLILFGHNSISMYIKCKGRGLLNVLEINNGSMREYK